MSPSVLSKSAENVDKSESLRQPKKERKEDEQKSSENVDESESLRQSKKERKEEDQKFSANVDRSESLRQSKKERKEEDQKSSENVDESGNVRQSKRRKKEQEQVMLTIKLNTLTEALVDKESTKKAVCRKMKGTSAPKKSDIEKAKEIIGHVIGELNKTNVNKTMHGKVFETFLKTIETMLPDDSSER